MLHNMPDMPMRTWLGWLMPLLAGVLVVCLPQLAAAESVHGMFWQSGPTLCSEPGVVDPLLEARLGARADAQPEASLDATEALTAPADEGDCTVDPDADPSSNVCFEGAEVPASMLPTLLARSQAEMAAHALIDRAFAGLDAAADTAPGALVADDALVDDALADDALAQAPALDASPAQPRDDRASPSCSTDPEKCQSLPPLPPSLVLDVTSPAANVYTWLTDHPAHAEPGAPAAWARLRLGPHAGFSAADVPPPRLG